MERIAMRKIRAGIILLAIMTTAVTARAEEFHVAVTGSDEGPGTAEQPFATVERARNAVRAIERREDGALKQPVPVWIHGGTYRLTQPLRFAPEDSGAAQCPVTYSAFGDERPVLSGGQVLTGRKETVVEGKHLWALDLPAVRQGKWYFRELWVNGGRRPRARHPNTGFFRITAVPDMDLKENYFVGQNRFQYAPGELAQWNNLDDVDLVLMTFWVSSRRGITGLDASKHMVSLSKRSSMRLTDGFGHPQVRYHPARKTYYCRIKGEVINLGKKQQEAQRRFNPGGTSPRATAHRNIRLIAPTRLLTVPRTTPSATITFWTARRAMGPNSSA
jgi:hypothetical protein